MYYVRDEEANMACEGNYLNTLPMYDRIKTCDVYREIQSCMRFPLKQMVAKALQNPEREGMYKYTGLQIKACKFF